MPGNYSKVLTVTTGQVITASERNNEHDNHISNATPDGIDDASSTLTEMRIETDPYPASSESLSTSLKGELERLRYQVTQILQAIADDATRWYHDAPTGGIFKIGITSSNEPAVTITNSGTGKPLQILDGASECLSVSDGGAVAIAITAGNVIPLTLDVASSTNDIASFKTLGSVVATIDNIGRFRAGAGTSAAPGISFNSEPDCGLYVSGTNSITMTVDGTTLIMTWAPTQIVVGKRIIPDTDNAYTLGNNANRWSEVWAANGAIQTSVGSTKKDIKELKDNELVIPQAIKYKRIGETHNSDRIGFLADSLPPEAFAIIDDQGNRSTTDVYTSAVLGMLCYAVKKLSLRLDAIGA